MDRSIRIHPEGFEMYHQADGYIEGGKVLAYINSGRLMGNLLLFSYEEWLQFPKKDTQ